MKLMPYDFSIIDKAGKENKGADVLSHRPHLADFLALALPFSSDLTDLQEALKIDPYTRDIMQALVILHLFLFFCGRSKALLQKSICDS